MSSQVSVGSSASWIFVIFKLENNSLLFEVYGNNSLSGFSEFLQYSLIELFVEVTLSVLRV